MKVGTGSGQGEPGVRRRRAVWIGVPVVLLLGGIGLLLAEIQYARTRSYAPDPEYVIDELVHGRGRTIELGVVGDSTVAGLGAATIDDTLPVQVARELAKATGRPVRVRAWGVSGARTRDVLDRQLPDLPQGLDVLVAEIGSNDAVRSTKLDALERDTTRLLRRAGGVAPIVVLGSAGRLDTPNFKQPLRWIMTTRSRRVRDRQRAVATREGVGFVDIGGAVGDRFNATPNHLSDDGFHPAGPGYGVWAVAIAGEAARLMGAVSVDD